MRRAVRYLVESIRKPGLQRKIVGIVLAFFLVTVLMTTVICLMISERNTTEAIERSLDGLLEQRKEEIERYLTRVDEAALTACYSSWLQNMFEATGNDHEKQRIRDRVADFLYGLVGFYEGTHFAIILDDGLRMTSYGETLDYSVELSERAWYAELEEKGKYVEIGRDSGVYRKRSGWSMCFYYLIKNNYTLEREGILVATIPQGSIARFLDTNFEGGYAELYGGDGVLIAGDLPEELRGASHMRQKEAEIRVGSEHWRLVVYLDRESITLEHRALWLAFAGVVAGVAVLFLSLAVVMSRYLIVPITQCRDAMNEIRDDHMGVYIENRYQDELGDLLDGFNEMSASIHELIEKNRAVSMLQKETEYQMLLEQINPHFLYNTLELINGLIFSGRNETAVHVCETLGQIFRYNLNRSKWVTVREELDHIRKYLMIMEFKIKGLSVYYEVAEDALERKILKAILQPLVENCIRHGFAEQTGECCITVMIRETEGSTEIMIMDNGAGIAQERREELTKTMEKIRREPVERPASSVHVGIQNVFHRMYLEYQQDMDFEIVSKEGAGTRIRIRFP